MKEIVLTRGKVALVDDIDYEALAKYKWYSCKIRDSFYAYRNKAPRKSKVCIAMHREILGLSHRDGKIGYHRDRNALNNQRYNLRVVPRSLLQHRNHRSDNTSGYRGVFHSGNGYVAKIGIKGQCICLGYFHDPVKAALIYDAAAIKQYGINANLNFPKETECKQ